MTGRLDDWHSLTITGSRTHEDFVAFSKKLAKAQAEGQVALQSAAGARFLGDKAQSPS